MSAVNTTPPASAAIAQLEADGMDAVIGTAVNPAGLVQTKVVPMHRTAHRLPHAAGGTASHRGRACRRRHRGGGRS